MKGKPVVSVRWAATHWPKANSLAVTALVLLLLAALTACGRQPTPSPATTINSTSAATEFAPPAATGSAQATAAAPLPTATSASTATSVPTTGPLPATLAPTAASPTTAATQPSPCPATLATLPALSGPHPPLDIVYISEGNVWLWTDADAGAAPLAILDRIRNARLSGDGQQIAFVRQAGAGEELWVIARDGTGEQRLMDVDALRQLEVEPLAEAIITAQMDWVPGTHFLAFNSRPLIPGLPERLYNDFRLIDSGNGNRPLWLPAGAGGAFSLAPDGNQIALWQPGQISLVANVDQTVGERIISYTADIELSRPPQVVWAPDSRSLRVALPGAMDVFTIWELSPDGVPPHPLVEKIGLPNSVAISPNLALVAYLRPGPEEFDERELHIAAADGSWDVVYDSGPLLEFTGWSPDGLRFTYQTMALETAENQQATAATAATAFIGALCAAPISFSPMPVYGTLIHGAPALGETARALIWADPDRFVYVTGEPGAWQLRLGHATGESELLAEMLQPAPIFDLAGDR